MPCWGARTCHFGARNGGLVGGTPARGGAHAGEQVSVEAVEHQRGIATTAMDIDFFLEESWTQRRVVPRILEGCHA
jgi:hypothetical protein